MRNYSINEVAACRKRETGLLALVFLGILTATSIFGKYLENMHRQSTNSVLATQVRPFDTLEGEASPGSGILETHPTSRKAQDQENRMEMHP